MRMQPLNMTITLVVLALFSTSARSECGFLAGSLDEDTLTILRLTLGERGFVLDDGVMAYSTPEGDYLPIAGLSRVLDFHISLNDAATMANGWFLQPDRRFELDLNECDVTVSGESLPLDPVTVIAGNDDIYVSTRALQSWFPLQIEVDTSRLMAEIHPMEKLPVEQRLERQENWRGAAVTGADEDMLYPVQDVPYRFWDWPFIDLTAEVNARQYSDTTKDLQHRYKVMAVGDLMLMNTEFSAVGDETDALRDIFLTMSRYDEGGNLLGPLNARQYVLGDMGIYQDQLIANSVLGRGFRISSFPLHRPEEFHAIDLRGELPLGWDVELYQNNRLVNFHSGDNRARYDFTAVPLEFGINEFRLVFYGPQGQVREERFQKVIGPGMVTPGRHHFRVTALEEREDGRIGSSAPPASRIFAAYEWGLSPDLSLGGSFKSLIVDDTRHNYGTVNLNTAVAGFFSSLEVSADDKSGHAVAASLFGRLAGVDIRAETAHFKNFRSERTLVGGPGELLNRSRLRLNTWLPTWRALNASLGLTLSNEQWSQGRRSEAETRVTISHYRWNLTQGFEAHWTSDNVLHTERLHNLVLFSTRLGAVSLRGELDQEILPDEQIHNLGLSADWRIQPGVHWHLGFNHSPSQDINAFNTGLNWQFKHVSLGGNLQINNEGELIAGLTLSSGLLREPQDGSWRASSLPNSQTAAVATRVFLDQNNNGRWDEEEALIPEAQVQVSRAGTLARTDENGHAFLPGLPVHQPLTVSVTPGSLDNPFWQAEGAGRRLNLRPGRSSYVELPVVPTGLIEGNVYLGVKDGEQRALSSVSIQLFSTNSELVQQTYSAYDGYYTFEGLRPGQYRIRISPMKGSYPEGMEEVVFIGGDYAMSKSVDFALASLGPDPRPVARSIAVNAAPGIVKNRLHAEARFTIQLVGMRDETAAKQFIERHGLHDHASYFHSVYQGKPWYPVIYGEFTDREEARARLAGLPPHLREAFPWIRSLQAMRTEIASRAQAKPTVTAESWLPSPFTIQIIAMSSEVVVQRYIERHGLHGKAIYYETRHQGKPWFPVVYGQYDNHEEARSALMKLPDNLRQASPWIRSLQATRAEIITRGPAKPTVTIAPQGDEVSIGSWLSSPFTIQIVAMSSEAAVQRYIERHALHGEAIYFKTRHQGKPWFPVVYGQYANREEARSALMKLPDNLRQPSPWIRSLRSIQADLASKEAESASSVD